MKHLLPRREFVEGVLATVVGFACAVGWDVWKDSRRVLSEERRAQRLVLDEIETNISLLREARERLGTDIEAAKVNKEVIAPPPQVPTEAWRTTRLAGIFSPTDDLAKEIGPHGCYELIPGALPRPKGARSYARCRVVPIPAELSTAISLRG